VRRIRGFESFRPNHGVRSLRVNKRMSLKTVRYPQTAMIDNSCSRSGLAAHRLRAPTQRSARTRSAPARHSVRPEGSRGPPVSTRSEWHRSRTLSRRQLRNFSPSGPTNLRRLDTAYGRVRPSVQCHRGHVLMSLTRLRCRWASPRVSIRGGCAWSAASWPEFERDKHGSCIPASNISRCCAAA
jgi:hypothetical protein